VISELLPLDCQGGPENPVSLTVQVGDSRKHDGPHPGRCAFFRGWDALSTQVAAIEHRVRNRTVVCNPESGRALLPRATCLGTVQPVDSSRLRSKPTGSTRTSDSSSTTTTELRDRLYLSAHVLRASSGRLPRSLSISDRGLRLPSACDRSDRTPRTPEQANRVSHGYPASRRYTPRAGSAVPARFLCASCTLFSRRRIAGRVVRQIGGTLDHGEMLRYAN